MKMKSHIFNHHILNRFGWLSALAAIFCLGLEISASAGPDCNLSFSPNPAPLTSYITVYPYYNSGASAGLQQQLISTFLVDVTSPTSSIPQGLYPAWCVDESVEIVGPAFFTVPGTLYSGKLYSTCDPNLNSELPPGHTNTLVSASVWQMVNYILNYHTYNGSNAFYWDVQAAINTLVGSAVGSPNPCGGVYTTPTPDGRYSCQQYPVYDTNVVKAILTAASNNAPGWIPQCGNVLGAIYVTSPTNQFIIIELPVPCAPCIGVSKMVACLGPTNSCGQFGKTAEGYVGVGCAGVDEPAFCYQITVTNCGTIPLTNIVVSDNLLGNLTTNFFTNKTEVFEPGASVTALFSMSFAANATNTVTVTGDAALAQTVTNGASVYTNGTPVSASDTAVALVDTAAVTCSLTLYSPLDLDGNTNDNNVILPVASYYSTPLMVTLGIHVANTGHSELTGVTINVPGLQAFNCSAPGPFNLAAGAGTNYQLCLGFVTCPAQMNFDLSVTALVAPDTNHCGIYDLSSTNVSVCSSCLGSISCSTNSGCLAGTANLSGAVLLDCSPASSNLSGDSGLAGVPVTLFGATNNPLATNTTDVNGNYSFNNLAAGVYYVLATLPTNFVQTYPPGNTNSEIAVTIVVCTNQTNVDFGYANTLPPTIYVVPGGPLGCNPTNLPTDSSVASQVTAVVSCGAATTNITHVDSTNGCLLMRTFTIIITDTYGNSATNSTLTYTWTANATPPVISGVPVGKNYGCNPASVPSSIAGLSASNACGTAAINQTNAITTNGCLVTQIFTIVATDGCGNTATAYVTNTWTANATPPVISGVPAGTNYGCNPASVPSSIAGLSASNACGTAAINQTNAITTNGCLVTQIFTIVATDNCGNTATAYVTNTWTANATPPVISGVPAGKNYGCNPASVPSSIAGLSASNACGAAAINQTNAITTNGCLVTQIFTIVATDNCGNTATAYVTNTWTADTTPPVLSGVPAGKNLGCNPTNVPTAASVQSAVQASDTCSPATVHVTGATSTNGCAVTQIFTIIATNACGNTATAYVTNTWTADTTAPVLSGVPAGANLGCNPTNVPTVASVQSAVKATDSCSPATVIVTGATSTNGCGVTQIFTIVATNACGNRATAYVTNTWTADTAKPVLRGVPAGANLGCNPTNVPTAASVKSAVSASDACSTASVNVTGACATNGCAVTQIFTIVATDGCGNTATAYVTNTWTADTALPVISGVPANSYLGCSATNLPGDTNVLLEVSASGHCGTASVRVTHLDTTNGCTGTRTFTITATDGCGNMATTNLIYTWNAGTGPVVNCPTNVVISTNVCKLFCTFTPSDWNGPCIGYNNSGCNNNNWNWNWKSGWNNYGNNWWTTWCQTNPPANCWPSWSNWWMTCNGTNPGTNWWQNWTNSGNGNHWSGCWANQNQNGWNQGGNGWNQGGNWWNTWAGNNNNNSQAWVPCAGNNPGDILTNCFAAVYSNGCVQIGQPGNGYCLTFTSPTAVRNCLNLGGNPGVFNCSATNPTTCNAGSFCSQVLALQLNCSFGDCSNGAPAFFGRCGDAVLTDSTSPCNGQTVRQILATCNQALGCGSLPPGCTLSNLCCLASNLNQCFEGCQISGWCSNHLAPVYIPPPSQTGTATVTDACSPNPTLTYSDTVATNQSCQGNYVITRTWLAVDACGYSNFCNQTITIEQGSSSGVSGSVVLACSGDTNLADNVGIANVTVTLETASDTTVATTTTSANGSYAFANVPAGTYVVEVTPPSGYSQTCPSGASNSQTVTLSGCQTLTGVSFGYTGSTPAVCITKTGPQCIAHGQTATYCFAVTNTGNTCLALQVNDPLLGGIIFTKSSVPAGQGYVFSSTYVVTQTNGCLTNTAWAIGTPPSGGAVSNQATTTAMITTKCVTNTICGNFNSQNPGGGWVWCNAHVSGTPGKKVTVFCQNASLTLNCQDGKSYTFPIPNGQINFSPTCTVGTNWFDGTQWNTTLPCAGDDQIFLQGCAIPWQSDFANCQSVCWTGVFSCDTAGFTCNWQWGAACYNNSQPACGSISPKACHKTSCPNGQYYNSGDNAGCPENTKPYCVGGATGGGGSNCTGSWSGTGSCSF